MNTKSMIIALALGGVGPVLLSACSSAACTELTQATGPFGQLVIAAGMAVAGTFLPGGDDLVCRDSAPSPTSPPEDEQALKAPGGACAEAPGDGPCIACLKASCCSKAVAAYHDPTESCVVACLLGGGSAAACSAECGESDALADAKACALGCAAACTGGGT
jgi:hypothetical protein